MGGARQLRGNRRESRNLLGTFPFNAQEGAGEHHGAHDAHHGHHGEGHGRQPVQALEARAQRQGDDTDVSFPAVAAAGPGADGKRCIDKVEMIEETEYDDVSSATTPTTGGATPPMSPSTSPSRRRTARRTSGRTVSSSMSRLPSTRPLRFAGPLLSRIVISRDLRSAGPSTNLSAGPSRRSTMWRMMSSSAPLRLRRSARTRPLDTPATPSAPSGPGRFAACPRSK